MTRGLLLSVVFFLEILVVYFAVTDQFPISGDDYSYEYQAKLMAVGKLYAEDPLYDKAHPLHDCIATNCITDYHGRRFSKYPPGWPAVLAVGAALQVPWLVNPVLGVLLFVLMLVYVEDRMGKELVNVTALLLTSCLFFVYFAASRRAHIVTTLFVFAAFLAYDAAERRSQRAPLWLFVAGAFLGYSSLIRYIDWIPLGAWIGVSLLWRRRIGELIAFAVGFLLLASGNLLYDMLLSGHPFTVPAALYPRLTMTDRLMVSPDGFVKTGVRLAALVSIFPPLLLLFLLWRRYRPAFKTRMYVGLFLMNIVIYFFYPAVAGGPGPRYFLSYFPFLVLAVVDLYRWICNQGSVSARQLWTLSFISLIVGNLVFVGVEAYTLYGRRDLERTAQRAGDGKKIFLLKTGTYHTDASDLTRNPPTLSAAENLYFRWCEQPARDALLKRFPERKIFIYEYPGHLSPYVPANNISSM